MLELKNIHKIYQVDDHEVHAVNDVNLTFNRGEFVSILGLSGSGKTTLISLIGGLEEPSSGELIIDDINTGTFSKSDWTDYRKNTIGFVFQDFNLIQHLSAIDNIKIALSLSGHSDSEKESRALDLLKQVNMMDQRDQFPSELSGGQQQRVAIARALANNPEIILADEPSGALDPDTAHQIMMLLQELSSKGHLVIMVTHDEYLANDYSTRLVEIDDGIIIKNTSLKPYKDVSEPPIEMQKSSLQFKVALKVAINNLFIRKKSTLFAMISLVPSILIVMILGNFVTNLLSYQDEINPIYNNVVSEDTIQFISPQSTEEFERLLEFLLIAISKNKLDYEKINSTEALLYEPFSEEVLSELITIDSVEAIIAPNYYDVTINNRHFILVGLLPSEYKDYQYDFDFDYYPNDDDEGLILSTEAAKTLLGKYNKNTFALEGQPIEFEVHSYNSIPLHENVYATEKNVFSSSVLKVFDAESKTTLMAGYYEGYIYAPCDYIETIKNTFSREDVSLIAYQKINTQQPYKFSPIGAHYLTDLIEPLRDHSMLQEGMDLFTFKTFPEEIPSSDYLMKYRIISSEPLTTLSKQTLSNYGTLSNSQYDDMSFYKAKITNKQINRLLFYAKGVIAAIILLPSLLVALILYISIIMRTKEIGILKSIGAKAKDIVTIFTLESGLLAISSGMIALVILFPTLNMVKNRIEMLYHLTFKLGSNPLETNLIAIVSYLVGIVTLITLLGLLPGRKASKLHARVLLRKIN